MKLIMEGWRQYLNEEKTVDGSNRLFLVRSTWGVEKNKWDHIGFLLTNGPNKGMMKDMSGHRTVGEGPIISSWKELRQDEHFKHLPETKEKSEEEDLYREIELPLEVRVPDEIVCRVVRGENRPSENCGTFVVNVLYNNEIDIDIIKKIPGISVAKFDEENDL